MRSSIRMRIEKRGRMRRIYYYSCNGPMGPLAILGGLVLLTAAFFIALPLFLAALVAFGGAAAYLSWRINRAIKRAERELLEREQDVDAAVGHRHYVIDITPGEDE